jgi:hypothetical protein
MGHKPMILAGLMLGTIFSILRFSSTSSTLSLLMIEEQRPAVVGKTIVKYILNQFSAIVLLAVSLKFSQWLFMGMVAGILMVPAVIFINGLTEGLGITHNNFE